MISLESDKMNTFWPNDSLTLTFYEIFLDCILNLTTFVKKKIFVSKISLEIDKMTVLSQMSA